MVKGAMSLLKVAVSLLLIAMSVAMGLVARGVVAVTVGASEASVPLVPNIGSLPPQPIAKILNINISKRVINPN